MKSPWRTVMRVMTLSVERRVERREVPRTMWARAPERLMRVMRRIGSDKEIWPVQWQRETRPGVRGFGFLSVRLSGRRCRRGCEIFDTPYIFLHDEFMTLRTYLLGLSRLSVLAVKLW